MKTVFKAIVTGVSAGGFKILHTILPMFPASFRVPILVVQHRVPGKDNYLIESLNTSSLVTVKEADDKEELQQATVYIAPGGYHMLLEKDMSIGLNIDPPVSFSRPSIDVLFESAAYACKEKLIGLILTGANSDGSAGIATIKRFGGTTIAQTPESAESTVMPTSAIATGCVDHIQPIEEIVPQIINLTG